jgi:hypothetical protein
MEDKIKLFLSISTELKHSMILVESTIPKSEQILE